VIRAGVPQQQCAGTHSTILAQDVHEGRGAGEHAVLCAAHQARQEHEVSRLDPKRGKVLAKHPSGVDDEGFFVTPAMRFDRRRRELSVAMLGYGLQGAVMRFLLNG
jgi:hypothetical protein